jgi:hypothetical protein
MKLVLDGTQHDVAIDYSDYTPLNGDCAERCPIYFKMQYQRGGYGLEHIVPGGFVPGSLDLYAYLSRLRRARDRRAFRHDVYGRFALDYQGSLRGRAIALLSATDRLDYAGGERLVRYSRFLRDVSRTKICIDLPGNGDFCFRLIDCLAVGSCVIGPRHGTALHVPLVDGQHIVYTKDDLSDLIELCAYYLNHDAEREAIAQRSREFFDKYLSASQLAAYYLHIALEHVRR